MERTGERYGAARRVLLGGLSPDTDIGVTSGVAGRRVRVSEPEVDDTSILRATGRDWDEWCRSDRRLARPRRWPYRHGPRMSPTRTA